MSAEDAYRLSCQLRTKLGVDTYTAMVKLASGAWRVVWDGPAYGDSEPAVLRNAETGRAFVGQYLDVFIDLMPEGTPA